MGNFAATASMAARLTHLEALVSLEEDEQLAHVPDRVEISYSSSSDSFDISMVHNGDYILRGATAPEVTYLMATGWYRVGRCSIDGAIHYMWPERR